MIMTYTPYEFDFNQTIYQLSDIFGSHWRVFTKDHIAYRYHLISPKQSKHSQVEIIKRKVLYDNITGNIYDPISCSYSWLVRHPYNIKEGYVSRNYVWFREDNDTEAVRLLLENKLVSKLSSNWSNELQDLFIKELSEYYNKLKGENI